MTGGFGRGVAVLVAAALLAVGCAQHEDGAGAAGLARTDGPCTWPMAGFDLARLGVQTCRSRIDSTTVGRLEERWFFPTSDVTTTTPVVADGVAYVGDWAGQAYAVDLDSGTAKWTADLSDPTPVVYAGQITAAAALTSSGGRDLVLFASGPRLIALDRGDGSIVWDRAVGSHDPNDPNDPTEIETGPAVVPAGVVGHDPLALVGFDVHNQPGYDAGIAAVDVGTGDTVWQWAPPDGRAGCADVWGGPSVDVHEGLVYTGTGNCPGSPGDWGPHSEAMVALDLKTGKERWTFQPHEPNNDDLDFAGTPNLFEAGGRDVVGLGNKDGHYYVVDRSSGISVWEAAPTEKTMTEPGSNYSTGGIIGPTAVVDGTVVATSAGDKGPFLHGIDADTGKVIWQQRAADATYAGVTAANDLAFSGGNDFTLRAVQARTGKIKWTHEMRGVVAAAPAIVGDRVVAVAGLREPGSPTKSTSSGVYLFGFPDDPSIATTSTTSTTAPDRPPPRLAPTDQACVGAPCVVDFQFKDPPAGLSPTITAKIDTDPFRLVVDATGLGPPQAWLRADGPNAGAGATAFGVLLSESDDDALSAGILCVLDDAGHCEVTDLPQRSPSYSRLTLMALADADTPPTLADGYDRLVVTHQFDPALQEVP